jgi:hypothetical protein
MKNDEQEIPELSGTGNWTIGSHKQGVMAMVSVATGDCVGSGGACPSPPL